jgi:hypothetical protein
VVHKGDHVISYYFFRDAKTNYKNEKIYECIGSINDMGVDMNVKNNGDNNNELFINNFYNCIDYFKKKENIRYIIIENISNNNLILKEVKQRFGEIQKMPYSYYFYNLAIRPKLAEETMIIT